jgi:sRNA-binding regulator protein Hfq
MANHHTVPTPDAAPLRSDEAKSSGHQVAAVPSGPRKLVRPTLPSRALENKNFSRRNDSPILAHHEAMTMHHNGHESTHAEAFYFQKQAQTQTPMVFVLEDGERIEGYIEWYDRNVIKVRNHSRTLIYKSSIKYLYKANEHI